MNVLAVPTIASGLAAALSVLFFTGLSRVIGDALLGQVILVQAVAAIVVILCVPQCWVYMIAAQSREELVARYRRGFSAEVASIALGALVIAPISVFPLGDKWSGILIIYTSLAVQASSSCLGWLRATENWRRYTLWVLGANLVRVPLIWATPWLVTKGWLPDVRGEQALVMAIYFLAPDLVRWIAIALPIAFRHYRWPGLSETIGATRIVLQNWLFDVGSSLTDTADKVVVGALLGSQTLVAYFFARRLSIVATMVCEPFYAEHFRRNMAIPNPVVRRQRQAVIYRQGLGLAFALFVAMMGAILVAALMPVLATLMPNAVLALLPLFALVLLFDCLIAANRWSRFIVQLNGGSLQLLGVRLVLFSLFVLNVWLFGNMLAGLGLALAFGLSWLLEAAYVSGQLRQVRRQTLPG